MATKKAVVKKVYDFETEGGLKDVIEALRKCELGEIDIPDDAEVSDLQDIFMKAVEEIAEDGREEEIPDNIADAYNALFDVREAAKKVEKEKEKPAKKEKAEKKDKPPKEKKERKSGGESRPACLKRIVAELKIKDASEKSLEKLCANAELMKVYDGHTAWVKVDLTKKIFPA